jgi:hypothetical protein
VTYPLTKGRQVVKEIPIPRGYKPGEPYTNTPLRPYYDPEELEAALANTGQGDLSELSLESAKYCLHAFIIEICYCAKQEKREADDAVPLILHRIIRESAHFPTLGQREAVTRAY